MATMTRVFEFDAAHRVMNERVKCFNLHGHRFKIELTLGFAATGSLGYAIDFKEIKRVIGGFIDKYLDHGCILNPKDIELICMCIKKGWKLWVMGLGNDKDINPSAENIASELFYIFCHIFRNVDFGCPVLLKNLRFYETPNCWVDMEGVLYGATDLTLVKLKKFEKSIIPMEYDKRKVTCEK